MRRRRCRTGRNASQGYGLKISQGPLTCQDFAHISIHLAWLQLLRHSVHHIEVNRLATRKQ